MLELIWRNTRRFACGISRPDFTRPALTDRFSPWLPRRFADDDRVIQIDIRHLVIGVKRLVHAIAVVGVKPLINGVVVVVVTLGL